PGEAASTASWIDCPGVTLCEAAGAAVGVQTTAKPRTAIVPMLTLPCFTLMLSLCARKRLGRRTTISCGRGAGMHRAGRAALDLPRFAYRRSTSAAARAVCVPRSSDHGVTLFPFIAAHDGSVFVCTTAKRWDNS